MHQISRIAWTLPACLVLAACSSSSQPAQSQGAHAPDVYQVNMDTSKGAVVIEVHRDWAPLGADRLYELVKSGYFAGARFFRARTSDPRRAAPNRDAPR